MAKFEEFEVEIRRGPNSHDYEWRLDLREIIYQDTFQLTIWVGNPTNKMRISNSH